MKMLLRENQVCKTFFFKAHHHVDKYTACSKGTRTEILQADLIGVAVLSGVADMSSCPPTQDPKVAKQRCADDATCNAFRSCENSVLNSEKTEPSGISVYTSSSDFQQLLPYRYQFPTTRFIARSHDSGKCSQVLTNSVDNGL